MSIKNHWLIVWIREHSLKELFQVLWFGLLIPRVKLLLPKASEVEDAECYIHRYSVNRDDVEWNKVVKDVINPVNIVSESHRYQIPQNQRPLLIAGRRVHFTFIWIAVILVIAVLGIVVL